MATNVTTQNDTKEIEVLVAEIRAIRQQQAVLDELETNAKTQLRTLLEARGEGWTDESGYARISAGGERVSYDTKSFDTLILAEPKKFAWLADLRKVTTVKSSLAVK